MAYDLALGEDFLRDAFRATVRDIANLLIPGSAIGIVLVEHVGLAFCKAAWDWLRRRQPAQRQLAIDALTRVPVERARALAESELDPSRFSPDRKRDVASYLSAIPMTARRAISRPDDRGTPTTLLSQLPQGHADLLRFVPLRPPRFQPGDQLPGHDYRLELLLGQGGFGEVWKARHMLREAQPSVALKFCLDPALLVSLKTEIKLLDVLGAGRPPKGVVRLCGTAYRADPPFLVYEYVDGGDLAGWLASFGGRRPSVRDVVKVVTMTARALTEAHRRDIVHRDLKPANLLVTREGRIKISDFGIGAIIARAEAQSGWGKAITGASLLQGAHTPLYADPLQRPGDKPDPKVDVYALGIIAYQLLTGDVTRPIGPAWRGDLEQSHVPVALLDVIAACVDIPSRRLPDAGVLLSALDDLALGGATKKPLGTRVPSNGSEGAVNYCIQCGVKAQPDDRFCIQCGQSLAYDPGGRLS